MFYYPPDVVLEVQTTLNTNLVICPLRNQTIVEIKGIVEGLHVKLFPQHGEIQVIKVKALLQDEKITVENGDVIGNIFTEWDGKIIVRARKRKSDASHTTGPSPSLLPSNLQKEITMKDDPSLPIGPDPSLSNPEILVDPASPCYPSHAIDPDPNLSDQEIQLSREPPKWSKLSTETVNSSKACENLRLPNSSEKTGDGNDASHATGPTFYDGHVLQKSPLRRSTSSTETEKLPKAVESSFLPRSSQKSFPTSSSLAGNLKMSRPSTDNANSPITLATSHIPSRSLKIMPTSSSLAKLSSRSSKDINKCPRTCETCGSLVRNLKRSPPTSICVIGPDTSSGRADMTKAFWDFWETFKQRRLKMVAYVPNRPMKPPIGLKRRVIVPKTKKRLGVTGKP